ncbi:MAG: hypothetical protein ACTSPI_16870 [Candidatus Heimdallarchaeaceae archaeon]
MTEYVVKTWKEIAKYTPFHHQTLRKKYGEEMLAKGVVFKSRLGRKKHLTVWAFPSQIMKYFTLKGQKTDIL